MFNLCHNIFLDSNVMYEKVLLLSIHERVQDFPRSVKIRSEKSDVFGAVCNLKWRNIVVDMCALLRSSCIFLKYTALRLETLYIFLDMCIMQQTTSYVYV